VWAVHGEKLPAVPGEDGDVMLAMDWIALRLRCEACGAIENLVKACPSDYRVTTHGEFVPVACVTCGVKAASPTVQPWELTHNDREFLKKLRIRST
jgi:hypothetical protein